MDQIIVIALLSGVGLVVLALLLNLDRWYQPEVGYPYEPRAFLYDSIERKFLGYMVRAVGKHFIIFGKVRIADVLRVRAGEKPSQKKLAMERIARDHIDFLLCDPVSTRIICAVELYDPRQHPRLQIKRARILDRVFKAAGVPLVRFPRADKYKALEIESSLAKVLDEIGINIGVATTRIHRNAAKYS